MRYFADSGLALADLKSGLAAADRTFKIDGGEVLRGQDTLAEIEINRPGSDLFSDEIAQLSSQLHALGPAGYPALSRIQNTQSILAVQMIDQARTPEVTMELLAPFWQLLSQLSTGLWHVPGQGLFENGQFVVAV
jgi:hypothetical protein